MDIPEGSTHEQDAHVVEEMEEAKVMDLGHGAAEEGVAEIVEEVDKSHANCKVWKEVKRNMIYNTGTNNLSYILRDDVIYIETWYSNTNSRPISSHTGAWLKPSIDHRAQCPKCCLMITIDPVLPDVGDIHTTSMNWFALEKVRDEQQKRPYRRHLHLRHHVATSFLPDRQERWCPDMPDSYGW